MDQYTMLSWKVRGLNMRARRDALRVLVGDIRPAILCVQETKLVVITQCTSVYGPQADGDKALFMDELEAIRDACSGPWAVLGDFNLILDAADKNNARINRRNMGMFRRVVDRLKLCDMHLHGRLYTWSNERANPTLVKLDRLLASLD
jgi:exonuclease III